MSFSVDKLKGHFAKDPLAFTNRYKVFLPLISEIDSTFDLNLLCNRVSFPGRQIVTQQHYTSMRSSERVTSFGVDTITMSFMLTENWTAWSYIDAWQNICISRINELDGYKVGFKSEYAFPITVQHLNAADSVRKTVLIEGAFPTTLTPIEFANEASGVSNCLVTFQFENWRVLRNTNTARDIPSESRSEDPINDVRVESFPLPERPEIEVVEDLPLGGGTSGIINN